MNAATVAVATTCSTAERTPDISRGSPLGTSTWRSTWHRRHPDPASGVTRRRGDRLDAGVRAGEQRRDGEQGEHQDARDREREVAGIFGPSHSDDGEEQAEGRHGAHASWPATRASAPARCDRPTARAGWR